MDKNAKTMIEISSLIILVIFMFGILVVAQTGELSSVRSSDLEENKLIDFSSLILVNRSLTSDTYINETSEKYFSKIYIRAVNMKNLSGQYEPYEDLTDLTFDGENLILTWNDKSVKLEVYTKDQNNIKEKLKDKSSSNKNELNFKTTIQKNRGSIYYNHTLVKDKQKQPKKIGYDVITKDVNCVVRNFSLICNEQKIDFSEAVLEQGLNVEIDNNYIEISGEDLSYIDPSITIDVEDGAGEWGKVRYRDLLGSYRYDSDDLTSIGASDNVNHDLTRGWVIFDVDTINDNANIDDVDLYLYIESSGTETTGCSDNDIDLRFYEVDAENIDETPDTEAEESALWNNISLDSFYAGISNLNSSDDDSWISKDLGYNANLEVKELIDGVPEDEFMVGIKVEPDDEVGGTDCRVDFEDTPSDPDLPYIIVIYTIPDTTGPSTSWSATSPPGGPSYSSETVTNDTVQVSLSCGDGSGSGCKTGYPKYCIDDLLDCSPDITYSSLFNVSRGGISYLRSFSKDNANNTESFIKNRVIVIDRNYTQNVSLYINNTKVWNYTEYWADPEESRPGNFFAETETTNDFADELNNALDSCTADAEGYCDIPIVIHSDSAGKINITNINIYFNITEYIWDITGLPELSTYKVRVKATDGLLNSSWDESDDNFTISTPDNPPSTTLITPADNSVDTDGTVTFNCSATDDSNLVNITLYSNWSGGWHANETKSLSGISNSTTFTKTLSDGIYEWNCLVYDNVSQSDWADANWSININITVLPDDTHKFIINNPGYNVAWIGNEGNVVLKGSCFYGGNCDNPGPDSFIIRNITNNNVAYINSTGDLCVETGDCSDQSATCDTSPEGAFIYRNSSLNNVFFIDKYGDMCLVGRLYENSNP